MKAPIAKRAFLTQPAPGVVLLNLQVEGKELERFELTRGQLANINFDLASFALRDMA